MTTPGRLIEAAALVTGKNRHTVEKMYDALRASGEVPKGTRGRYGVRVTSAVAAKLILAICGSEHVRDASHAVRRYEHLTAQNSIRFLYEGNTYKQLVVPSSAWQVVATEFPNLAALPQNSTFGDAIVALIDAYCTGDPRAEVSIALRGPYPGAHVSVTLENRETPEWRVEIDYQNDDRDDVPGEWLELDSDKERRRRRIYDVYGDLKTVSTISDATLRAIGAVLREESTT